MVRDAGHPGAGRPQAGHFGVGLWLVRRHTEALKGQVIAENRPDGGFAVTVSLPRILR